MALSAIYKFVAFLRGLQLYVKSVPVLFIFIPLNEIARFFISRILLQKSFSLVSSGWDSIYTLLGNKYGSGMIAICIVSDSKGVTELTQQEEANWLNHRLFQKNDKACEKLKNVLTQKCGYSVFHKRSFEIQRHVKIFPEPITDVDLRQNFLSKALEAMPPSKPQWEWWLLPSVKFPEETEPKTVRIFRFSGGYFDRTSALILCTNMLMDWETSDGKAPWIFDPTNPPTPVLKEYRWAKLLGLLLFPFSLKMEELNQNGILAETRKTKRMNYYWSKPIPFQTVESAAEATESSFTSVLIYAMTQAIRNSGYTSNITDSNGLEMANFSIAEALYPYDERCLQNRTFSIIQQMALTQFPKKIPLNPLAISHYYRNQILGRLPLFFINGVLKRTHSSKPLLNISNLTLTNEGHMGTLRSEKVTNIMLWANSTSDSDIQANFVTYNGNVVCYFAVPEGSAVNNSVPEIQSKLEEHIMHLTSKT